MLLSFCTGVGGAKVLYADGQKKVTDPLELELQAAVSHPVWGWNPDSGPLDKQ